MPLYEYERPDGHRLEVLLPMRDEKPERIFWDPTDPATPWRPATPEDPADKVYQRVWVCRLGRVVTEEYRIDYGGGKLPASHALGARQDSFELVARDGHQVRKHKDGTFSDLRGRPIVTSKRDSDAHCAATGSKRVKATDL